MEAPPIPPRNYPKSPFRVIMAILFICGSGLFIRLYQLFIKKLKESQIAFNDLIQFQMKSISELNVCLNQINYPVFSFEALEEFVLNRNQPLLQLRNTSSLLDKLLMQHVRDIEFR